jgi:hypothetical protein
MRFGATVANAAWCASCLPAYFAFRQALDDPQRTQLRLLRRYVQRNAGTAFGQAHRFDAIDDLGAFRRAVPIADYDSLASWIDRIAAGEQGVLTADRVARLMPSSGSTRAAKLIPYTGELQREFNRAIGPWIVDLYRQMPDLMGGCAYWSVTPVAQREQKQSAVPIGFDDDSEYLGGLRQRLVRTIMAVPGDVRHIQHIDDFRFATLVHLLARRDLRLISVWHPSFLQLLLDGACERWDDLLAAMKPFAPNRAAELRSVGADQWPAIWPRLRLISCWADANAAGPADALHKRLPQVTLQPKGLLATEAFISIPFSGKWPLSICSHFLEFEDDHGRIFLCDELRSGGEYGVIVTTAGGLWRYRLGDRVRCDGRLGRTPSIRFIGRNDLVVDHLGEKLNEGFVGQAIRRLLNEAGIQADFAMLAPDRCASQSFYTLFVSTRCDVAALCSGLTDSLDRALQGNPHYAYCRRLGQLGPPRLFRIRSDAYATYVAIACKPGSRLGDVKPLALHSRCDWSTHFSGEYLQLSAESSRVDSRGFTGRASTFQGKLGR